MDTRKHFSEDTAYFTNIQYVYSNWYAHQIPNH